MVNGFGYGKPDNLSDGAMDADMRDWLRHHPPKEPSDARGIEAAALAIVASFACIAMNVPSVRHSVGNWLDEQATQYTRVQGFVTAVKNGTVTATLNVDGTPLPVIGGTAEQQAKLKEALENSTGLLNGISPTITMSIRYQGGERCSIEVPVDTFKPLVAAAQANPKALSEAQKVEQLAPLCGMTVKQFTGGIKVSMQGPEGYKINDAHATIAAVKPGDVQYDGVTRLAPVQQNDIS